MLDYELEGVEYNQSQNSNSFYLCYPEEEHFSSEISTALSNLSTNNTAFQFFDLGLPKPTSFDMEIPHFDLFAQYSNLKSLKTNVEKFFQKLFYNSDNVKQLSSSLAETLSRYTSIIVSESEHTDASIRIIAQSKHDNVPSFFWHIDKSHPEILKQPEFHQLSQQAIFIITLLGETTLFYDSTPNQRDFFEKHAEESERFYGYWENPIAPTFNISQIFSAPARKGSIHFAGVKNGTIHTTPKTANGRLIAIITPDSPENLNLLEKAI